MKIAFVGKGGSGKSSTSWLIIKTIEDMGAFVLAIDADHNI
jgi:CO dehydrogenase nickel-insertion accessory protein CooC1